MRPRALRQQERERAAAAGAVALGERAAAVLPRDRSDDEQAETAALGAHRDAGRDAVEAPEDPLQLAGRDADAADPSPAPPAARRRRLQPHLNTDVVGRRVLHRVVEQIPDGRSQLVGVADDNSIAPTAARSS